MNKKIITLFLSVLLTSSLISCNNDNNQTTSSSSPTYVAKTDLERFFEKLKNNNFTMSYSDNLVNFDGLIRNATFSYTEYSCESEGDLGNAGIAQNDDVVFRYNIEDGNIITGTPLVNYQTGIRYESVYDYTFGFQNFDISALPKLPNQDGYYTYNFGFHHQNDTAILAVFLRTSNNGIYPQEVKMKLVKDVLVIETIILTYDHFEPARSDYVTTTIYNVGTTENVEIKNYLESGKTSKKPLDLNFYRFFSKYQTSINYTSTLDARGMAGETFNTTMKYTENAVLNVENSGASSGYVSSLGYVSTFISDGNKIKITGTPQLDESTYFTELYGEVFAYDFRSITYDLLLGYIDEEHPNSYILTDDQLTYMLAYICFIDIYESMSCKKLRLEIVNDTTYEFNLYFDLYNKTTNRDLGTFKASFYDLNETKIPEVDRYLKQGDDPTSQDKSTLMEVLNLFKNGNYSIDMPTSIGVAKYYYTENYFYEELYSNTNQNVGYIKLPNSNNTSGYGIYEFSIYNNEMYVKTEKDLSLGVNGLKLPGCGSYFLGNDDLGYFSHLTDALYQEENYSLGVIHNQNVWKMSSNVSSVVFTYLYGTTDLIYPLGTGIVVSKGQDSYDTRLTIISVYIAHDESFENQYSVTYYDIGNTNHPIIEQYLNNL